MESLPVENRLHILKYLPVEDLIRFKGLNHYYENLINNHKRVFPRLRPLVRVFFSNQTFSVVYRGKEYHLKIDDTTFRLTPCSLFLPVLESWLPDGRIPIWRFDSFISWLFSKIDVDVFHLDSKRSRESWNSAFQESECHVRKVVFSPNNRFEEFSFLPALGNGSTVLELELCHRTNLADFVYKQRNEVPHTFSKVVLNVYVCMLSSVIQLFGKLFANGRLNILKSVEFAFDTSEVYNYEIFPSEHDCIQRMRQWGVHVCQELEEIEWLDLIFIGRRPMEKEEFTMTRIRDEELLKINIWKKEGSATIALE